jgi:hypothetical protein
MYRPHFASVTPKGYHDELAEYPFDYRQLGNTAPPLDTVPANGAYNLILKLDSDGDFIWKSLYWEYPTATLFLGGQIGIRIRDAFGNYLSSDFVPILNYAQGYYVLQPWAPPLGGPPSPPSLVGAIAGGMGVPMIHEIFCPASSVLQIDVIPLNESGSSAIGRLLARGCKRRAASECAGDFR